jgi:ethanolamine transporter EutH
MISVKRLRCFVGWLAIALPWIVALLLWRFPASISATYYTYEAGPVFMIILGLASGLLMYYDGYDKTDDILNTIAGILGMCICLFPCYHNTLLYVGTFRTPVVVSGWIHDISAVAFFALLAYISFFQFTKSSGEMTKQKKIRNIIYRVCAGGMLGSFLILLLPSFYIQTWLVETIALFFFGISWLTKADAFKWLAADYK